MDHIGSYFSKVVQNLSKKIVEKEKFVVLVKEKTGIILKTNDFVIKDNIIKLKIFGPKRTKILSNADSILEDLNKDKTTIVVRLE